VSVLPLVNKPTQRTGQKSHQLFRHHA